MRNCVRCGAEIDPERLEFLPDTVTCAACSRVPAKATVCDPANGELVVLPDGRSGQAGAGLPRPPAVPAGRRGTVRGRSGRVASLDHADSVLSPRDTCLGRSRVVEWHEPWGFRSPRLVPSPNFADPGSAAKLPRIWLVPVPGSTGNGSHRVVYTDRRATSRASHRPPKSGINPQTSPNPLPWVPLPKAALHDSRLTPTDRDVLAALLEIARNDPSCYPSNRHSALATQSGDRWRTVQVALQHLAAAGWIRIVPGDNPTGRLIDLCWRTTQPPILPAVQPAASQPPSRAATPTRAADCAPTRAAG